MVNPKGTKRYTKFVRCRKCGWIERSHLAPNQTRCSYCNKVLTTKPGRVRYKEKYEYVRY